MLLLFVDQIKLLCLKGLVFLNLDGYFLLFFCNNFLLLLLSAVTRNQMFYLSKFVLHLEVILCFQLKKKNFFFLTLHLQIHTLFYFAYTSAFFFFLQFNF